MLKTAREGLRGRRIGMVSLAPAVFAQRLFDFSDRSPGGSRPPTTPAGRARQSTAIWNGENRVGTTDASGNVYFPSSGNAVFSKIFFEWDAWTAGGGQISRGRAFSGDGGGRAAAAQAQTTPQGLAVDFTGESLTLADQVKQPACGWVTPQGVINYIRRQRPKWASPRFLGGCRPSHCGEPETLPGGGGGGSLGKCLHCRYRRTKLDPQGWHQRQSSIP